MITPSVHLNGTSKAELQRMYSDAYRAVRAALQAVEESAPNARDYYVQSIEGAHRIAVAEHCARLEKLATVARELSEIRASL